MIKKNYKSMSIGNCRAILSSSTLDVDKWAAQHVYHKNKRYERGETPEGYSFRAWHSEDLNTFFYNNIVTFPTIWYPRDFKMNKKKLFRHVKIRTWGFIITDQAFEVYLIYNDSNRMLYKLIDRIYLKDLPTIYIYIGKYYDGQEYHYEWGDSIEAVREKFVVKADEISVYKISIIHRGGPEWYFGDYQKEDYELYFNIRDDLAKLSGKEYYDYCMSLIEYEMHTVKVDTGETTEIVWFFNMTAIDKRESDFLDPKTYAEMLTWERPIYWGYRTPYDGDGELYGFPERPK